MCLILFIILIQWFNPISINVRLVLIQIATLIAIWSSWCFVFLFSISTQKIQRMWHVIFCVFFLQRHLATYKLCPKVNICMVCGYCGSQYYASETAHMEVVENPRDRKDAKRQRLEDDIAEPETHVAME